MENNVKSRTMRFVRYKGLNMKEFEERCNLSTGYVTSMRKSFGSDKLNNVLNAFPDLNRDWLLYGEGEMLKPPPSVQTSHGDNSPNIAGNGNQVNPNAYDALLKIVESYQASTCKFQEQIDKLITIIEKSR